MGDEGRLGRWGLGRENLIAYKEANLGSLMRRVESLEKTLMLGGIGGRRRGDDRG